MLWLNQGVVSAAIALTGLPNPNSGTDAVTLRDGRHLQALWAGIADGTVDVLGSDHAPHTREEKDHPYPESPSGMTGVQTLVPLMMAHLRFDKATVGLIQATPALMGVLFGPPLARLATGAYRREALIGLFLTSAVACGLISRATTAAALVIPQMMFGLATAAFCPAMILLLVPRLGRGGNIRQRAASG